MTSGPNSDRGTKWGLFEWAAFATIASLILGVLTYLGIFVAGDPSAPPEPSSDATTLPPTTTDSTETTRKPSSSSRTSTSTRPATSIDEPQVLGCLAPELDLSSTSIGRGEALKVQGCGFWPNERVFGFMGRSFPFTEPPLELGSPITDEDGGFTLAFRVPGSFPREPAGIQFAPLDPAGGSATVEVTIR
jgi:hypothetical protein